MARHAVVKDNAPRQGRRHAVTAAVEVATPAADRQGQRQRQGEAVARLDVDAEGQLGQLDRQVGEGQARHHGLAVGQPGEVE